MANDWEVNPDKYATDENGEFILKRDGTPRKKSGRAKGSKSRGYNYHSKTKAKTTLGLVRMDGTSKLYLELKKKKKETNPRLWQSDWRK